MNAKYEYLDLLKRKLDPSQKAACCRTENTIVAAGAGSGKTQVLATRFAWLVMSKEIPASKILTLTFTKKAAAEMYSRIYSTLKFFADNEAIPQKERSLAKKAAADFSQVHIQTLDSYCASVVKQAANRYGIKPDFSGNEEGDDLSLEAFRFVLENKDNFAIKFYSENTADLQDFAQKFFAEVVEKYSSLAEEDTAFYENFIKQVYLIAFGWNSEIQTMIANIKALRGAVDDAGEESVNEYFVSLSDVLSDIPELFEITDPYLMVKDRTIYDKCTEVFEWVNKLLAVKTTKRKQTYKTASDIQKCLCDIEKLSAIYSFIKECEYLKEYIRLLDLFASDYKTKKRAAGNLSFKDILDLTLKILVEQEDIRTQEKNAYSKIMIDEFQDNNRKNRDLLFLLSEEYGTFTKIPDYKNNPDAIQKALVNNLEKEKLFFVGDEKQSIYKFRDADVSVFNQLKEDLKTTPVQMVYNYRSSGELLSTFNLLFGGFSFDGSQAQSVFPHETMHSFEAGFPKEACAKKVNLADYSELAPVPLNAENVKGHACIFNKTILKNDPESSFMLDELNQEAFYVAKKIREVYYSLSEEERQWRKFAILEKSTTNRNIVLNWLNRFGIPYTLDSQRDVFQEAPVNDIYNFLRLCVFPSDSKAFASVLASPLVNLSSPAVLNILAVSSCDEAEFTAFSSEYEQKVMQVLSEDEGTKYKEAAQFFMQMKPKVLSQSLALTVSELWNETGYRYETLINTKVHLLAEQYDLLFELARQADESGKNCSWFVEQLALAKISGRGYYSSVSSDSELSLKELSYPVEKGDAVQIMTIHKSKGLQFEYVFIYGTLSDIKSISKTGSYYSEETGYAPACKDNSNYFWLANRDTEAQKAKAELKRLIYVAITRAEKEFFIIGDWDEIKESSNIDTDCFEYVLTCWYPELRNITEDKLGKTYYEKGAPVDFYAIDMISKREAYREAGSSSGDEKVSLLESASAVYENNVPLTFSEPENFFCTPSSLETDGKKTASSKKDLYPEIDSLVKSKSGENLSEMEEDDLCEEDFSYGSFGTLVHEYLEAFIKGVSPEEFSPEVKLYKNLSEAEIKKVTELCKKICRQFAGTEEGKAAVECRKKNLFVKPEWRFYYYSDGLLFRGSMDLIYESAPGQYTLIDYKTDGSINAEKYYGQQKCYRDAAAEMLGIKPEQIRCRLYFIRYDEFIELTPGK